MRFATFLKQSELIKSRLTSIEKQVKTLQQLSTVNELNEQQLKKVKLFSDASIQKNLEFEKQVHKVFNTSSISDSDIEDEKLNELQEDISNLFINIQSICNTLLPTVKPETINDSATTGIVRHAPVGNTSVRLPQITIPTFSGDPEQWTSFQGIFENSIHNNESISEVEKFAYLLSCVAQEPLSLIKSLPINCANYLIAWQTLIKRYRNSRLLVALHTNHILDLPTLNKPNVKQIRDFLSIYSENYEALKALGHDLKNENLLLTSCILRKFDATLRSEFEQKRDDSKLVPTIMEVVKFLENECSQREAANLGNINTYTMPMSKTYSPKNTTTQVRPTNFTKTSSKYVMFTATKQQRSCVYCSSNLHNIYKCNDFIALSPQIRHSLIKSKDLCQNCFGTHKLDCCKSLYNCRVCTKRHHTLLHFNKTEQPLTSRPSRSTVSSSTQKPLEDVSLHKTNCPQTSPEDTSTSTFVSLNQTQGMVLLATALINISNDVGQNVVVRAVLDSASQSTIISEHCANMLQLKRSYSGVPDINGISSAQVRPRGLSFVNISSLSGKLLANSHPVIILDRISSNLPRVQLSNNVKARLKDYTLADPTFDTPGPIDLLLGADLFAQTLLGPAVDLGNNMPYALNTIFGYVVIGNTPISITSSKYAGISSFLSTNDLELHDTLKRFWTIEEPPVSTKLSPQEEECEKHFLTTHSRDSSGRYICRIPFKESPTQLGDSSNIAKCSFQSLEKRFASQHEFKQKYVEFLSDYEAAGHMKLCESIPPFTRPYCLLPHHGVFKEGKIRVVFNASAPTTTGVNLNSIQYQGNKLHNNIPDIIFNFRQHKVVFLCDIKQMFRQILIHEDDQIFQLIYWRSDPLLPLQLYQLTTVTFGLSSSPYLANRVIKQLIADEGKNHPLAAKALQSQIFVDDAVLGCDTVIEALELQQDVIALLKKGGFELRKWSSNEPKLVENLPQEHCEVPLMFRSSGQPCLSVLGLKWISDSDEFSYSSIIPSKISTKRTLLSAIAQIYDPIGMLTPLVFWAKALMQYVWSLGLDWDASLPSIVEEKWIQFIKELPEIENLRIPRYLCLANAVNIQLHGFSDASEAGFAACVYLRVEDQDFNTTIRLLIAKSKVAPLKRMTIPRLELCGAHLLSKLLYYCSEQLSVKYKLDSVTAWCDSTIALAWIHTPSYRLKLFVSNRVSQIQELTPSCIWKHVSSGDNPADLASRGLMAKNLVTNDLWWFGPPWLKINSSAWPEILANQLVPEDSLPEIKSSSFNLMATSENSENFDFLTKYASWTTLLRIMAFVLRFISCLKTKKKKNDPFSPDELKESNNRICWLLQQVSFKKDIELLKKNKVCSSSIQRLSPFLDDSGILRVGGRLKNSNLNFEAKHPIILPKTHPVVHLIVDHFHKTYLHAGPLQLQAALQEHYWIISARSVIRFRVHRCLQCFKVKPKTVFPIMGDLPSGRVTPTRCFNISGVDYAGPFTVKLYRLRKIQPIKVYLCLFICFVSKAVHLEVATDLSTEAFIASLTRFISRRGQISHLHSDCGTNFIGTASSLKKSFEELMKKEETIRFAQNNMFQFHFNPPRAPHQGGLWERAIKSAKHHLKRVIGDQIPTYEEFITLTTRVEAMLNSRPITPLSADPNDFQPLTPGHFLTGGPLTSLIEPCFVDSATHLQRWNLVKAFAQHIWLRWKREYLYTLQERCKWIKPQENLTVGDLVVIHEDNSPPLDWKMGRIVAISPGKDDITRVVHIKTATKTLTRPSVKVSRLPIY